MAQENVIPSLFGLTPETYQQQRAAQLAAEQQKIASGYAQPGTMLNPSLAPLYAQAAQRGQMMGTALGGIFGMEDPQLKMVRDVTQMRQGFDVSTAEGLRSFAKALSEKGYTDLAVQAAKEADTREKTIEEANLRKAQAKQAEAGKFIQIDLGDRVAIVDPFTKETVREIQKGMKPGLAGAGRQEVVSNNGVVAGYVDAKGNFFNNQGKKISAAEQTDAQKSHDSAMTLLYKLENITEDDINKAFGSLADYTTMTGGRLIGPTDTIKAQTKINSVGISSVLDNLSKLKGASSDKEMTQMIKDFPGYQAKPEVMKDWIDRAVATTNRFLQRSEKRYGFDTDYGQEGRFTGAAATPAAPGQKKVVKFGDLK